MAKLAETLSTFEGKIERSLINSGSSDEFYFSLVPKQISDNLSRRGRTSAQVEVNGYRFYTHLEPDGRLSHWLKIEEEVLNEAKLIGLKSAVFTIYPLAKELEPKVPADLQSALDANPIALIGWHKTTVVARIDWIHWVETARQAKTRTKRINDAINMLCEGKLRVCCFDPSGFYSKAIKPPIAVEV